MSEGLVLKKFIIDVVQPVAFQQGDETTSLVQMISYSVVADTAVNAFRKFIEAGEGEVIHEGDVVERCVIGITEDN